MRHPGALSSRPVGQTAAEVVWLSCIPIALAYSASAAAAIVQPVDAVLKWWDIAGAKLVENLDWTIGSFVAVLLSFYIAVVAGDLGEDEENAGRRRALLGFVAETMAATLVFFASIIFLHCFMNPAEWGVWLAFAPVAALVIFLSLSLGRFLLPTTAVRLASARKSRTWARARLARLCRRTRRPVWVVFVLNVGTAAAAGLACCLPLTWSEALQVGGLLIAVSAVLNATNFFSLVLNWSSADRFFQVLAFVLPVVWYGSLIWVTVDIVTQGQAGARLGAALGVVIALTLVSAFAFMIPWPKTIVGWSIHGAAARSSARFAVSTLARSSREIQSLTAAAPGKRPKRWLERLFPARAKE